MEENFSFKYCKLSFKPGKLVLEASFSASLAKKLIQFFLHLIFFFNSCL